jgi:hypothetical protein
MMNAVKPHDRHTLQYLNFPANETTKGTNKYEQLQVLTGKEIKMSPLGRILYFNKLKHRDYYLSYTLIRGLFACMLPCSHNNLRNEPTNLAQTLEINSIRSKNYF